MTEKTVEMKNNQNVAALFGSFDSNLHYIEEAFGVRISDRSDKGEPVLVIKGEEEDVERAAGALEHLRNMIDRGEELTEQQLNYTVMSAKNGETDQLSFLADGDTLCLTVKGKPIKAKTAGQKKYAEAIRKNTVVLGIGPAGTGKTFLAVAMAVTALRQGQVTRLVLTRPAVEAGEKLGYLPGDLQSKIDPYLRPLYDALFEMLGPENYQKQMEKGTIEIAPLAYMRGRTLDDSFIILDEAQNTTRDQMLMFLTRMGFGSRCVVTGDPMQSDLGSGEISGLDHAIRTLSKLSELAFIRFDTSDVVRHSLLEKIINAYADPGSGAGERGERRS